MVDCGEVDTYRTVAPDHRGRHPAVVLGPWARPADRVAEAVHDRTGKVAIAESCPGMTEMNRVCLSMRPVI
ncbi:hypothetical protein GCM10009738_69420 [Kitasatospora viridis]